MKNFVLTIIGIMLIYSYIYAPSLRMLPFGMDKPFLLISILYITYRKQWRALYRVFSKEIVFLFSIFLVSCFVYLLFRDEKIIFLYDLLLFLEVIPCSWMLYFLFKDMNINHMDDIIIICSIIAGGISLGLLLNPDYAYFLKTDILKFPEHLVDKFLYRGYGFSDGLTFSYPVIQGFCLAFILLKVGRFNLLYACFSVLLFVSIMSNARSGFVPIFVAVLLLMFYNFRLFLKYMTIIGLFILFLVSGLSFFVEDNVMLGTSLEWSLTTFEILSDFFSGEEAENLDVLMGDMVIFPSNLSEWILGTGSVVKSDVGYFIRLNYGGLVYSFLWIFMCSFMFLRLYRFNKGMALLLFISLLYMNYKGDFFVVNPASRFFFLVYVLIILDKSLFNNLLCKNKFLRE